ncbi:E3 ubiquitin-protein ligase synoviolin [Pancytospora epiphaga]|nr:E3 ubiquitin-protein ligase synoviolin [Pancytospora epiphaga]
MALLLFLSASVLFTACLIVCKEYTFYSIFTTIATNNLLHLLHTVFVITIFLQISNFFTNKAVGQLSESEHSIYTEKVYAMCADLLMIISFFPSDLRMVSIIYFALLYVVKSFAWSYCIKAQRIYSKEMFGWGLCCFTIACIFTTVCWRSLGSGFSIVILFGLEYSLIALDLLRTLIIMVVDIQEMEYQRSIIVLITGIVYYFIRCGVYFVFVVVVSLHNRFPANTARSFITSAIKLRKKIVLLQAYMKLCSDLNGIPDTKVNLICPICQDPLSVGKMLRCKHTFHSHCLKMWCERETSCPICRSDLAFNREESIITDDEIITGVPIEE